MAKKPKIKANDTKLNNKIEIDSYQASAKNACDFYESVKDLKNPFVLSVGINAIEFTLKAMIEKNMGHIPEECKHHSLNKLCETIDMMHIPDFVIPFSFKQECRLINKWYTEGRYFNPNSRECNIINDYDFIDVNKCYNLVKFIQKDYEEKLEKALDSYEID